MKKGLSYLIIVHCVLSLTSCNVFKNLSPGERIVNSHRIKIDDKADPLDNKESLRAILQLFAQPRPDGKLLFIRTKVSNPAPLLDIERLATNRTNMLGFLKEQGYREAEIEYEVVNTGEWTANVIYKVTTNKLLKISDFNLFSRDTAVQKILKYDDFNRILKPGAALSLENSELEKSRIVTLLRNQGYTAFLPNYIDRIRGNRKTGEYEMEVLLINDSIPHEKYNFGNIHVYLEEPEIQSTYEHSDTLEQIIYHYNGSKPFLNTSLLNRKIEFRPGQQYSKKLVDESRVLLGDIPFLKRAVLSSTLRQDSSQIIDYAMSLQRNLNYDFSLGLRTGYVIINGGNRIGLTAGVSMSDRNLFGGGELFTIDYSGGLDLDLDGNNSGSLFNTNFQFDHTLQIPSFIDLYGLYNLINRWGILGDPFYENIKLKGRTQFEGNVQFLNLQKAYSFTNYEVNYGHRVRKGNSVFNITQSGLIIWNSDIDSTFMDIQQGANPNLIRSLESRLVTGLLFKSINLQYQNPVSRKGTQWTILGTVESSGHEVYLANWLYREISNKQTEFSVNLGGDTLLFAQFFKVDFDARFTKAISEKSSITFRSATGIALPYGFTSEGNVVPYLNQFDVGGPYSLRAWEQRELGPGAVVPVQVSDTVSFTHAQKGDIRFEFNVEYRFPIAPVFAGAKLNGALFMDIGNVWLVKSLPDAPVDFQGVFTTSFYKQMAIGGGYGLRLDFDYFVIRFDFGYKFRRPFANAAGRNWIIGDLKLLKPNLNFALGYPF